MTPLFYYKMHLWSSQDHFREPPPERWLFAASQSQFLFQELRVSRSTEVEVWDKTTRLHLGQRYVKKIKGVRRNFGRSWKNNFWHNLIQVVQTVCWGLCLVLVVNVKLVFTLLFYRFFHVVYFFIFFTNFFCFPCDILTINVLKSFSQLGIMWYTI